MAHYAFITSPTDGSLPVVTQVIVGRDEDDLVDGVSSWEEYYGARQGQRCLRTSYNTRAGEHTEGGTPFRGNYAGIGYTYMENIDGFVPAKPFPSWVLNETSFTYEPPIAMPDDGAVYTWDETAGDWVEVV